MIGLDLKGSVANEREKCAVIVVFYGIISYYIVCCKWRTTTVVNGEQHEDLQLSIVRSEDCASRHKRQIRCDAVPCLPLDVAEYFHQWLVYWVEKNWGPPNEGGD